MVGMNRRAFFRTVAAAAVVAPVVPHPESFPVVMGSRDAHRLWALDPVSGVSIRFIHKFVAEKGLGSRVDYLFGLPVVPPRLTLADIKGYGAPERLPA